MPSPEAAALRAYIERQRRFAEWVPPFREAEIRSRLAWLDGAYAEVRRRGLLRHPRFDDPEELARFRRVREAWAAIRPRTLRASVPAPAAHP